MSSGGARLGQMVALRDYLEIVRRRWSVIAAAFLLTVGAAVGMSLNMPAVYQASATVTIDKTPLMLLTRPEGFSPFADQSAAQAPDTVTLAELIRSETVREGALTRMSAEVGSAVATQALGSLRAQPVRNAEIVRIILEYPNPAVAARAANAVAAALIDMDLKARRRAATETREFIAGQLAQAAKRLRATEDALVAFKTRHGDVSLTEETSLTLQSMAGLRADLVKVQLERRETEAKISQARSRLARQARITPTQWTPSPLISTLQTELAGFEIERSGLRRQFTPKHPAILSLDAKIAETKRRLDLELARSLQTGVYGVDPIYQQLLQQHTQAEVARAAANARERVLRETIALDEARIRSVPLRAAELTRLARDAKEAEEVYLLLSERLQEARIAEASIGSAIRVVDVAKEPHTPAKVRTPRNILFGVVAGLMLGFVAAFFLESLDETVRSAEDVERVLEAPILGAVPDFGARGHRGNGRRAGQPPDPISDGSPAAEAYRALRAHVLYAVPEGGRRTILITSALPREGKSTTAVNLARSLARINRGVWLVDCDLRQSGLGRILPDRGTPALTSLLAAQADLAGVTSEASLWYIPGGGQGAQAAELLGTPEMARVMAEVRSRADISLLDSPAVLSVADAEAVGPHIDGALLVVRFGSTDLRALAQTRQRLERVGVRIIGAVLNFVPHSYRSDPYRTIRLQANQGNGGPAPASR